MKSKERHKLKENDFARTVVQARELVQTRGRDFASLGVIVVVAILVTESVVRWLDMLGLDPDGLGDRLVLTPACGLAGAAPGWAKQALVTLTQAGENLRG